MNYAMRDKDAWQHLLVTINGGAALCGAQGPWNDRKSSPLRPIPGKPLCQECKDARNRRKADAEMKTCHIDVKNFWLKGKQP